MHRFVPPLQGLGNNCDPTRGGAALCPGLICFGPFGATLRAIQLHDNHHRPVNLSLPFQGDPPRP